MQPTMKLRWLCKSSNEMVSHNGPFVEAPYKHKHCVLQQWWEETKDSYFEGEWRDVPIESED